MRTELPTLMKEAMKGGDKPRLATLRLICAAMKDREIEARGAGKPMTDDDEQAVLRKMMKQRQDSILAFEGAGRTELADQEKGELAIIQAFLPAPDGRARDPVGHRGGDHRIRCRRPEGHGQGHRGAEGQACRADRLRESERGREGDAREGVR